MPEVVEISELEEKLNRKNAPSFESIGTEETNLFEAFQACFKLMEVEYKRMEKVISQRPSRPSPISLMPKSFDKKPDS